MRAIEPSVSATVDRDGVRLAYDVYGDGDPTIVLVPTWSLFDARAWKMQIPYLARHYRVVTYDPRGNGRSDRPAGTENHSWRCYVGDLLAVMGATDTRRAVLVGLSFSGYWANLTAVLHPERVVAVVAIGPTTGLGIGLPERMRYSYTEPLDTTEGWAKENVHFIRSNYSEYVEFFVGKIFTEVHSTKAIEDGVGWAHQTDAATLIDSDTAELRPSNDMRAFYTNYPRPLLIIHGDDDRIVPLESSRELARITGGTLITLEGSGHAPNLRDPVVVNLLIREFVDEVAT